MIVHDEQFAERKLIETLVLTNVQVNNESAIEFYKKFGFNIVETKEQYYKRIEPADAHVLEKFLKEDQQTDHSKISNGVGEVGMP